MFQILVFCSYKCSVISKQILLFLDRQTLHSGDNRHKLHYCTIIINAIIIIHSKLVAGDVLVITKIEMKE